MTGNLRFAVFIAVAMAVFVLILRVVLRARTPRPSWKAVLTTAFIVTVGGMWSIFTYGLGVILPAGEIFSPF